MSMYGKYKDKVGPLAVEEWPVTDCSKDKGFTVQADRDEADINKIVSRFMKSGQLPPMFRGQPFYGDVSEFGDLQDALMKRQEAERLFMQFSADVRERFRNDPAELIAFLGDESNYDEALELGLVVPRPKPVAAPDPQAAAPVTPAAGGPASKPA